MIQQVNIPSFAYICVPCDSYRPPFYSVQCQMAAQWVLNYCMKGRLPILSRDAVARYRIALTAWADVISFSAFWGFRTIKRINTPGVARRASSPHAILFSLSESIFAKTLMAVAVNPDNRSRLLVFSRHHFVPSKFVLSVYLV